jgi:hypothetical protein
VFQFRLPGNTLPAFYGYVVGAVVLLSILITRGDLKAFMALSRRMAPLLAVFGVVVAALWLTRTPPPPLRSVDGVYTSSCCGSVELANGMFATTGLRVPFKLEIDKYGKLNAVPPVTLEVRDRRVEAVPDPVIKDGWRGPRTEMIVGGDPAPFIFTDDRKAFTLCDHLCATEYQFVRR